MLLDETWLTAKECKALGFCDNVVKASESGGGESKEPHNNSKKDILNKYAPGLTATQFDDGEKTKHTAQLIGGFLSCFEKTILKEN